MKKIIIILAILCLTSCSTGDSDVIETKGGVEVVNTSSVDSGDYMISGVSLKKDNYIYSAMTVSNGSSLALAINRLDINEEINVTLDEVIQFDNVDRCNVYLMNNIEDVLYFLVAFDTDNEENASACLLSYDLSNNIFNKTQLSEFSVYYKYCCFDRDGNIYAIDYDNESILIYDSEAQLVSEIEVGDCNLIDIYCSESGEVWLLGRRSSQLSLYELENSKLIKVIDVIEDAKGFINPFGSDYDLLVYTSTAVYGFDNLQSTFEPILNVEAYGLSLNSSAFIDISDAEEFLYWNSESNEYQYLVSKKEIEKTMLTIAICGASTFDESMVTSFNLSSNEYAIEVVDYYEEANYDYNVAIQRLGTELIAGKGPDIIDLSSFPIDASQYAAKGVFENLYNYIDKDDELDRSDYIENILTSCEYNGSLYSIMSGFSIKTMFASAELLDLKSNWTIEEFYPYSGNIGAASLETEETINSYSLLSMMCDTTFYSFIDYESGKADFNSQEFIDLLNSCKNNYDPGNEILVRIASVWDFMEIQYNEYYFRGNITYIGFPVFDSSASGNYINNQNNFLAMNAMSTNKDACWSFMRAFLTEEYQNLNHVKIRNFAFPTNINSLNNLIEYSLQRQYLDDEELTQRGQYEYIYQPATQEQVDQILELIYSVETNQRTNQIISNIFMEELLLFLEGNNDAQSVAQVIQNRVEIYLMENT